MPRGVRTRAAVAPIALSLCATLVGASGCDVDDESAQQPLQAPLQDPPIGPLPPVYGSCLTDLELTLPNAPYVSTTDIVGGLTNYAKPGDLVKLDFRVRDECLTKTGTRVTLAAYTGPGDILGGESMPPLYDVAVGNFNGKGSLSLRLPPCAFIGVLAIGDPIVQGSEGSYADPDRLVLQAQGGSGSCDAVPMVRVQRFDALGQGWGDAPLMSEFGWRVDAPEGATLSCSFDLDGNGVMEKTFKPCPRDTEFAKIVLPQATYTKPGRHRPRMTVTDGTRRVFADTTIYANHLDYKPDVRFPEQSPGFLEGELYAQPDSLSSDLVLTYASAEAMPKIEVGDVVVGFAGVGGYMLRVTKVQVGEKELKLSGAAANLEDVVAGGFYGVRDAQISTENARCVSPACAGSTVTPVALPPGAGKTPDEIPYTDGPLLKGDGVEAKFGVKIAVPIGSKEQGEVEVFGGVLIKNFELDMGLFSVPKADIDLGPIFEVAFTAKAAVAGSFDFGRYYLGTIPTPLPITLMYAPRLDVESALKFTGKVAIRAPMKLRKDATGWAHSFEPVMSGGAQMLELDSGDEAGVEAKAVSMHAIELVLGLLPGPYAGPFVGVAIKGMADQNCKYCLSVTLEGGGEMGWDLPWVFGDLIEAISVTLAEIELSKECVPLADGCEDPPPGGGSAGDVHLFSFDGLLLDFQAGGEFVLVRSTDPAAPFEVQTRQEPMPINNLGAAVKSLSINTAVATVVGGIPVGLYARHPDPVRVGGKTEPLAPNGEIPLGAGGSLTLDNTGSVYTITYPSGDVVTVQEQYEPGHPMAHFDVRVSLHPSRAGAVEGLLGDADGEPANDIALQGGVSLVQPVDFQTLYWAPKSFAAAWRVTNSLFEYVGGATADTFRQSPYKEMPEILPPAALPFPDKAQTACATCPESLRGNCMTDVGFTGDVTLAQAACQVDPQTIKAENPLQSSTHGVYPLPGSKFDCNRKELVFRARGAANAHTDPTAGPFVVGLDLLAGQWGTLDSIDSSKPPAGGWGTTFKCRSIGADWGECTWRMPPTIEPCYHGYPKTYEWWVRPGAEQPKDFAYGFTREG